MIVKQALTDAMRAGFVAAYMDAYPRSTEASRLAAEKFPYMQERVIALYLGGAFPTLFKVQSEDEPGEEGFPAGRLLRASSKTKVPQWESAWVYVTNLTPPQMRALADLIENPLENYVAPPPQPVEP